MKRILGRLTKDIAINNGIPEHANKKIVLYDNDRRHCEKRHLTDFKDVKTFHYIMNNLEYIIEHYDNVFYVKNKNTIEYYKTFDDTITVRVKVEEGRELKVKTVFPVKKDLIEYREKNKAYNKYVIKQ